jgi:hypothetical protein
MQGVRKTIGILNLTASNPEYYRRILSVPITLPFLPRIRVNPLKSQRYPNRAYPSLHSHLRRQTWLRKTS